MDSSERFDLSGPSDLTCVDWNNARHRRSVAACLVQGVYILERDRQGKCEGTQALAPPWWETFNFQLHSKLVDEADSSIFGAIFEYKPLPSSGNYSADGRGPQFVVAFRGNLLKLASILQDFKQDWKFFKSKLRSTSRFKTAMQAVQDKVAAAGSSGVWLAGHSLGSAMALVAGKNMAQRGLFLESFLFNPPYVSAPIEKIKPRIVMYCIRIAISVVKAMWAMEDPQFMKQSANSFAALSRWVPQLFVNEDDPICSGYIGYFEHRNTMQMIGAGKVGKIATRLSFKLLVTSKKGKREEPLHLIPSANLTINSNPLLEFDGAHGICQWWKDDLRLKFKVCKYD